MQDYVPPEPLGLAVIGLGYVGLPLAVKFGRQIPTMGFDISPVRVRDLKQGIDQLRKVDLQGLARDCCN